MFLLLHVHVVCILLVFIHNFCSIIIILCAIFCIQQLCTLLNCLILMMISFTKSSLSKSMQSWIPPTGWCWSFSTSSVYILWLTTVMIIITIPQWILLTVSALSKIYGWIKLPLATKCIHQPARDEADSTRSRWRSRTDRLLRLFSTSRRLWL